MKFNKKLSEIKIGRIYHWDVSNLMTSIHKGTKTVKVLSITQRVNANPLVTVLSVETKELFKTDIGHLQLSPEYLKIQYYRLMSFYRRNNPKMIFKHSSLIFEHEKYVIIGDEPEVNNLLCLDKNGIIHSLDYSWFEGLDLNRNENYDREQEEYMNWCSFDDYDPVYGMR